MAVGARSEYACTGGHGPIYGIVIMGGGMPVVYGGCKGYSQQLTPLCQSGT
jgi:hypothetical protein